MSRIDYEKLIRKYSVPVKGEILSKERLRENKAYQRKTQYHQIAEKFMGLEYLNLNGTLRDQVYYIIDHIKLKDLHHKLSAEAIILCVIFYIMKSDNSSVDFERYKLFKEYGLNSNKILTVWCRLLDYYRGVSVVKPIPTTDYNHEVLYNRGVKTS